MDDKRPFRIDDSLGHIAGFGSIQAITHAYASEIDGPLPESILGQKHLALFLPELQEQVVLVNVFGEQRRREVGKSLGHPLVPVRFGADDATPPLVSYLMRTDDLYE